MPSEFQLLLQQAKQNVQSKAEPSQPKQTAPDLSKLKALPSEIQLKPKARPQVKETTSTAQKTPTSVNKMSFQKLMKLAKQVKPEGLIKDATKESMDIKPKSHLAQQGLSKPASTTLSKPISRSASVPTTSAAVKKTSHSRSSPAPNNTIPRSSNNTIQKGKMNSNNTIQKVKMDGRGRLNSKGGVETELIKMNVKKRDLATIEEIEEERRLKKLKMTGFDYNSNGLVNGFTQVKSTLQNERSGSKSTTQHKSATQNDRVKSTTQGDRSKSTLLNERVKSTSQSHRNERVKSTLQSNTQRISKKIPESRYQDTYRTGDISRMFGYDPSRYNDDSDSSDMEVGYKDVEREERKSFKIAKREDEEEERKLLEREKRKLQKRKV